ncbi:DUF1553 domain-containing protein [Spirosoma montaniterrae]|uniref:Cytochrome c domain-containing protein n=1 Tax=Spirosoma montaniterrae TaxID=1178516 RepID=A0A1P9WZC7_9BACT|nr:DUF1553 domain-containing protein [Spirosoma montaniterrae]AQG80725.1 hypothetical protein AWR27_16190 [Spirosoma montaniterrae]
MVRYLLPGLASCIISLPGWWLQPSPTGSAKQPTDGVKLPTDVRLAYEKLPPQIDYNQYVKPVLSDKCFACHGPDKAKQKAGLRLDMARTAYGPLPENPGRVAIRPGNWQKSEVALRILSTDPDYQMPTPESHLSLSAHEKAVLLKWINDGAVYQPHWAFVKPQRRAVPTTTGKTASVPVNEIDRFIHSRLAQEGLEPSPEAPKDLLLRRLSLDLTGLPPTLPELDAFLADNSPNAYEKQVDRLLATPYYGEKMATDWLDVARFADSHGYTVDRLRDMSPYRDWVIRAFNQNLSYREFIHQQLAGDLMKNPTRDQLIATAFNRLHQQNMEGGIVEEEFQTEYVMDRTNTLGDAFLAISLGCARCHDHKYDPISQQNYYELYSFFNNVREAGQISWNDDPPTPTLLLPTDKQAELIAFMKTGISQQQDTVSRAEAAARPAADAWIASNAYQKLATQEIPQAGLQGYYTFEDSLVNTANPMQKGVMKRDAGEPDKPVFEKTSRGQVLLLNGDTYADLKDVGVFRQADPFTVGLWVWIPKNFREGVIFHKANAERLYNFKGYHLMMKANRLEISMAHTAPSNAITRQSLGPVPRETWVQLTMTYDGSSKADGFKLYLNGAEMPLETVIDQLYKDIIFFQKNEPALQIGGWWRGLGFKGGKVDEVVVYNRTLTPFEVGILSRTTRWSTVATKAPADLNTQDRATLQAYYLSAEDADVQTARMELQKRRTVLSDSMRSVAEIMVMQEMPIPKKAFVLQRGQYDRPGLPVLSNTPPAILPFSPNANRPRNRLGLAEWLTDPNHPLTARVAVNRYWQLFFGTGLVKTAEDFGNQGETPSHPDLLDWLAVTFQHDYDWDVKRLVKLMVMSATYRQDSHTRPGDRDAENRLLARGPSARLSAEMIRDNALLASGLLNPAIGGRSVKPYQPDGLWDINSMTYKADSTDAVYRRSLYVVVKRSVPNPTLATFDAPARSSCIVRRQRTNTPLQALVTLNDPTFLEAARVLGEQMAKTPDIRQAITQTYRRLTGRMPQERELALLTKLYQTQHDLFRANRGKVTGWLNAGLRRPDSTLDPALIAANAVVASTILNSDATLTKR